MKHRGFFRTMAALALVLVPLAACDDEPVVVTPDPIFGTVSGTVSVESDGLNGVTVQLAGATAQSATTSASGAYTFSQVPAGTYSVTISGFGTDATFGTTSQTVTIATQAQALVADFAGTYIRTGSIIGTVMTTTGVGVPGVTVALSGRSTATATSDAGGNFNFSGLRSGDYTMVISNLPANIDFAVTTRTVTVATGQAQSVSFSGVLEILRGTVSGTVSVEGTAVPGVSVQLTGPTSQTATTDVDGKYTFAEVIEGSYTVTISGFGVDFQFATTGATVTIDTQGQAVTTDFMGTYVRTATITGNVATQDGDGVPTVQVDLTGPQTGSAVTGAEGEFKFDALRKGTYTLSISALPEGSTFTDTSQEITIATGQTQAVVFVGTLQEQPAKVIIKSITAGNLNTPVNPAAVAGVVNVTLTVNEGDQNVTAVHLMVDGVNVQTQTFASTAPAVDTDASAEQGLFDIIFTLNTAAVDAAGTALYFNGARSIGGGIDVDGGTTATATASQGVTFANPNVLVPTLTTDASIVGSTGLLWQSGSVVASIAATLYTPAALASATFTLSTGATKTDSDGSDGFSVTFSNGSTTAKNGVSDVENAAVSFGVTTLTTAGGNGPALGASPAIRLDNVGPVLSNVYNAVRATQWVNNTFSFGSTIDSSAPVSGSKMGSIDGGVGYASTSFEAGTSSTTLAAVTSGADLPESFNNQENFLKITTTDLLGNSTTKYYAGPQNGAVATDDTGVSKITDAGVSKFGVDHVAPTNKVATGSLKDGQVIGGAGGTVVVLEATDTRSSFPTLPFQTNIIRVDAASSGSATCAVGNWSSSTCKQISTNGTFDFAVGPYSNGANSQAYYQLTSNAQDQSGLEATPILAEYLIDTQAPVVGGITFDATLTPGASETFSVASISDNLDLWKSEMYLEFGAFRYQQGATQTLGAFGGGTLTRSASASNTITFVRSIEFNLGGAITAAGNVSYDVWDFATNQTSGNPGTRQDGLPAIGGAVISFGVGTGPTDQVTGATLTANNTLLCGNFTGNGCTSGTKSSSTFTWAVTGAGSNAGGPLANQFRTVTFVTEIGAPGSNRWKVIGSGSVSISENAAGTVATYKYTASITGGAFGAVGDYPVWVIGLNDNGTALGTSYTGAAPAGGVLNTIRVTEKGT